jgi:protein SCO1
VRPLRVVQLALWGAAAVGLVVMGLAFSGALLVIGSNQRAAETTVTTGRPQIGGPFRLTSHTGATVTDQDLQGKPFGVFFGFTHCPEVCPTTLFELTERMKELGPDADKITFVFVTVDPERDTQAVLADYMQAFDPRIVALTGTADEIAAVAKAYKAFYRKVPTEGGGYTMDHTAIVYLMDKQGQFVSSIDSHENKDTQLVKLRRVVAAAGT